MTLAISPWIESPIIVLVMLIIVGVCSGLGKPAGQAMLIDVSTKENRKFIFSFDYWSNNIALLLGMMVGGILFKSHKVELMLGLTGASLLSLIFLQFFISETLDKRDTDEKPKANVFKELWYNYKTVIRDTTFALFMLASFLEMSIEIQASNYLSVRLVEKIDTQSLFRFGDYSFSVDGYQVYSLIYIVNTLTVLIFGVFVSWAIKRLSDRFVLFTGLLVYTFGYGFLAYSNSPWALLFVMVFVTLGELTYVTIKQSVLADITPSENRSSYMAVNNLSYRGASLIAPLSVSIGAIMPYWGMSVFFILLELYLSFFITMY